VNPFLRSIACVIVLGASFGVGLLIFPAAAPRQVLAQTETPDTASLACRLKTWLHLDRDCAARREPRPEAGVVAADGNPNPVTLEAPSVAAAAKPPAATPSAELPREALQPTPITPPERETAAQLPQQQFAVEQPGAQPPAPMVQPPAPMAQPPAPAPQPPVAAKAAAPRLPLERHAVERHAAERHAAERRTAEQPEATIKEPPPAPVKKKFARREPAAKRPATEALRTVRKFDDKLQDIPVDAYAADGSRRSIVIRPTSIQDVYYYSVPR
jgi:hypothetical protein